RGGRQLGVLPSTTRRDRPALNYFPGHDGEWIVWMPEGFYDTSIAGDRRLLGWHVNKVLPPAPAAPGAVPPPNRIELLPSVFHPIADYEKQLYKPEVINQLLQTGDLVRTLLGLQIPPDPMWPAIRILQPAGAGPGVVVEATQPRLNVQFEIQAGAPER